MLDRMKSKMPGMKEEETVSEKKKPMAGIEIEIEGEEGPKEEEDMSEGEGMADEEVSVGELAKLSDEELLAEVEKRGLEVATGGAGTTPLPEVGEEEMPQPKKKPTKV
jgi:hypothetical protein